MSTGLSESSLRPGVALSSFLSRSRYARLDGLPGRPPMNSRLPFPPSSLVEPFDPALDRSRAVEVDEGVVVLADLAPGVADVWHDDHAGFVGALERRQTLWPDRVVGDDGVDALGDRRVDLRRVLLCVAAGVRILQLHVLARCELVLQFRMVDLPPGVGGVPVDLGDRDRLVAAQRFDVRRFPAVVLAPLELLPPALVAAEPPSLSAPHPVSPAAAITATTANRFLNIRDNLMSRLRRPRLRARPAARRRCDPRSDARRPGTRAGRR